MAADERRQLQPIGDAAGNPRKHADAPLAPTAKIIGDVEWIITREGLTNTKARLTCCLRRKTADEHAFFEASRRATGSRACAGMSAEPPIVETLSKHGMN